MDMQQLPNVILLFVLIGILIGISLVIVNNLEAISRDPSNIINESITMTFASGKSTGQTSNDYVTSITTLQNASGFALRRSGSDLNITKSGAITAVGNATTGTYNVTYSADLDTVASNSLNATAVSFLVIPNTWLGLLVTIVVLTIVVTITMRALSNRN